MRRYANSKLNIEIINKLLSNDSISSKQIDILLWLALRQDEFGRIFHVKYHEVSKDINICFQSFYECIENLVKNNMLRVVHQHCRNGWDIEIINNIYVTPEDDKKRYLNINLGILHSLEFQKLRANEKKLMLKLLIECKPNKNFTLYFKTIYHWLGIENKQLVLSYLSNLQKFKMTTLLGDIKFCSLIFQKEKKKKEKIILTITTQAYFHQSQTTSFCYFHHKIKQICRIYKVKYSNQALEDVITLITTQYKNYLHIVFDAFCDVITKKLELIPKLINFIVSRKICYHKKAAIKKYKKQEQDTSKILLPFIREQLTVKEQKAILNAAQNNIELIKEKYQYAQSQNIYNLVGYLIAAVKGNYQTHFTPKKNKFVNFEQRTDWDFEKMEQLNLKRLLEKTT